MYVSYILRYMRKCRVAFWKFRSVYIPSCVRLMNNILFLCMYAGLDPIYNHKGNILGTFGVSRVRRCLNEARVSADRIASGKLFHSCKVEEGINSAYVRVLTNTVNSEIFARIFFRE